MNGRGGHGPRVAGWLVANTRRLLVFVGGVSLLVLSVAVGWLPGPGGIPLALAGLWLLSTEFDWAKRWRRKVQARVRSAVDKVKTNHEVRKTAAHNVRELRARGMASQADVDDVDRAVRTSELDIVDVTDAADRAEAARAVGGG